ncbi:ribosomal protein S7 domain-containing protein [Podospora didyma]|uniref:Small ribosomal subunit protein uS7m n=1 Tax=Podospora didyma TaxID=330526 RepID=A0AAE0TW31_9PEZI|nr:ribosomal protein S7 domain-containing protein [Podospora didyma]
MPPRLNVWSACRALSIRTRPVTNATPRPRAAAALARGLADLSTTSHNSSNTNFPPMPQTTESQPAESSSPENQMALSQLTMAAYGVNPFDPAIEGHKFGLPELPLPSPMHMKHRYDPVVLQITKLLMRDGKLSKAQRDMAMILNYLRTSPPPKLNPSRPLLPGAPPPSHLPFDPVMYLTVAIESVAPLIRIRGYTGIAGGGHKLDVPAPLAARQRRRIAMQWILDVVAKKNSKGSGRGMFPSRVAEEIIAVVEGRSPVWDKRQMVHKVGTAARANLNHHKLIGKL